MLDPLMYSRCLPLRARFFPSGFPLEIETDSESGILAAADSWGMFPDLFDTPPLRLQLFVESGGSLPPEPAFRGLGSAVAIVSDRANFAWCSYPQRSAYICVTEAVVRDRAWFRYHFLEATVYLLLAQLHVTPVHAACVARDGAGVLLAGVSGAGKTSLAYACARRGWTYVADDSASLVRGSPEPAVLGKPHQFRFRPDAGTLFPELRGRGEGLHPNGKPTVEVRTCELPGIRTAFRARVRTLVFLHRTLAANGPALCPVEPADALSRLENDLPLLGHEVCADQRRSLTCLFGQGVSAFDLHYSDPFAAADCLEVLVCGA